MVLLDRIHNVLGKMPSRHGRLYGPSCALIGAALTLLAWIALFGLPAQWQSRVSNTIEQQIAAQSERGKSPETERTPLPTDSIEETSPLEVSHASERLMTLERLQAKTYWDLSLEEVIQTSTCNSKDLKSMGGRYVSQAGDNGSETVLFARTNRDVSSADFERAVQNLVSDTQNAYWELSFAWRNLENANTALNSARQTWKRIHQLHTAEIKDDEPKDEAQAREQHYQFKCLAQTLFNELLRAEKRLRYIMGIASADGRLIRPIDLPTVDKVSFDWDKVSEEALARSPELRWRKWRVKQKELELLAAKNLLKPSLDSSGKYRWLGLGDKLQGQEAGTPKADNPSSTTDNAPAETFDGWQFQEWALGTQVAIPLGLSKELAAIRSYQLKLARGRAKLQDEELEVSHQLSDAIRQVEYNYELTQSNFNRALAADKQVDAVQAAFDAETVTLDQLLEAQRRRTEAQTSYSRTLLDYQKAIVAVNYRKGSLR